MEPLESRVNPVKLVVVGAPFPSASPHNDVQVTSSTSENGLTWHGEANATLPPGLDPRNGEHISLGRFRLSGVLTVLVQPEAGDVPGTPLTVHVQGSGALSWDDDPLNQPGGGPDGFIGCVTSHARFTASANGANWFNLTGGHRKAHPHSWSSSSIGGSGSADIQTTIGGTVEINMNATGSSGGVWVGGSGDYHGEIGASMDVAMTFEQPEAGLTVKPKDDDAAGADVFGTYLAGVSLPTVFTATPTGSGIAEIELTVAGLPKNKANEVGTRKTVTAGKPVDFKIDPGYFTAAGEYALTATGYDADGEEIATFPATVKVIDTLDLKLRVAPAADPPAEVKVGDARLLEKISVPLAFTADISDLPLAAKYKPNLDIGYRSAKTPQTITGLGAAFSGTTATFSAASAKFADAAAGVVPDYLFSVMPKKPVTDKKFLGSAQTQDILVLPPPTWLKKPNSEYKTVTDTPGLTSGYVIPVASAQLSKDVGPTAGTPYGGWLNNLANATNFNLKLRAVVPLDKTKDVQVLPDDWTANATVLGHKLFAAGAKLDKSKIDVTVDAERESLAFNGMTVETAEIDLLPLLPDKLLFEKKIPAKKWTAPIPAALSLPPLDIRGRAEISGTLTAHTSALTAQVEIKFKNDLTVDTAESFFAVQAEAEAKLNAVGTGGVDVGIMGLTPLLEKFGVDLTLPLIDAAIFGTARAGLDMHLQFPLAGTLGSPKLNGLDRGESHADLTLGYQLTYDVALLKKRSGEASDEKPLIDPGEVTVSLFGLGFSPAPRAAPSSAAALAPRLATTEATDSAGPDWTFVPPAAGGPAGRVTAVLVDSADPATAYVGTAGGVFRTRDGGATWTSLTDGLARQAGGDVLAVGSLALAPAAGGRGAVLFVGTGEANHRPGGLAGVGVYRIDDADGATPTVVGPFRLDGAGADVFSGRGVSKLLIDPADPDTLFVATTSAFSGVGGAFVAGAADRGVYRTRTALGVNPVFTRLDVVPGQTDVRVTDMAFDGGDAARLLVAVQGFAAYGGGGVYRSADALAAAPAFARTLALPDGATAKLATAGAATVYVATDEGTPRGRLRKSVDGGLTWTPVSAADGFAGPTGADLAVAADPAAPAVVYVGGGATPVRRSADGGATFADVSAGLPAHPHALAVTPAGVFVGTESGVWRSATGAAPWLDLNATLPVHTEALPAPRAVGPGTPAPVYTGTDRLLRSTDGGATQKPASQAPLAADVAGRPVGLSGIAVSPQDDRVRLASIGFNPTTGRGAVFATTTGAAKLKDISFNLPPGHLSRVVIDPADKNTAYVTVAAAGLPAGWGVWRTTNLANLVASATPAAASRWQPTGAGLPATPVNALVVDPADSWVLYAATDAGVFRSADRGMTWASFGQGLPPAAVVDLTIAADRTLTATTHARGRWTAPAPGSEALAFTTPDRATVVAGAAAAVAVAVVGPGPVTLTVTGKLPAGVKFSDNKDGTATLAGKPAAGAAKAYPLTITASTRQGQVSQAFTLTVGQAPKIVASAAVKLTAGRAGSVAVLTSGFPTAALGVQGALPAGLTFTDLGNGKATLAGTPAANAGGVYSLVLTATNGIGPQVLKALTLTVSGAPVLAGPAAVSFAAGEAKTVTFTAAGYPVPALALTGTLPAGLTFTDNNDGTATLAGTAGFAAGNFPVTVTAKSALGTASRQVTVTVTAAAPLIITGPLGADLRIGEADTLTFGVVGAGGPAAFGLAGTLPTGVTFTDHQDGTATFDGTPAAGTAGEYDVVVTVTAAGVSRSRTVTLTVGGAATFTSPATARFTVGIPGTHTFTAAGPPAPVLNILPAYVAFFRGLTFDSDTGVLSGTPAAGTGGVHTFTVSAANGFGPDAHQAFQLEIHQPLTITTPDRATVVVGQAGPTVRAISDVTPTFSLTSGALPAGLTFEDAGEGAWYFAGAAEPGSEGVYTLVVTAHDGIDPDVSQTLTLTVKTVGIVTPPAARFDAGFYGYVGLQAYAAPGLAYPVLSLDPAGDELPAGVNFTAGEFGDAGIDGVAAEPGVYHLLIRASSEGYEDVQPFTLTIE